MKRDEAGERAARAAGKECSGDEGGRWSCSPHTETERLEPPRARGGARVIGRGLTWPQGRNYQSLFLSLPSPPTNHYSSLSSPIPLSLSFSPPCPGQAVSWTCPPAAPCGCGCSWTPPVSRCSQAPARRSPHASTGGTRRSTATTCRPGAAPPPPRHPPARPAAPRQTRASRSGPLEVMATEVELPLLQPTVLAVATAAAVAPLQDPAATWAARWTMCTCTR